MTAADITFNEDDHTYWRGMERVPSVSEILRPLTESYFSNIPEAILNRKRDVGIAVHRACELIDLGHEIDPDTLDADVNGYVEGYRKFLVDMKPTWTAIEQIVFDEKNWYAGRLDRIGQFGTGSVVIDIKTSASLGPSVPVQLTAYARAHGHSNGQPQLAALQLLPKADYKYVPMFWEPDVWDALLTIHKFKETK